MSNTATPRVYFITLRVSDFFYDQAMSAEGLVLKGSHHVVLREQTDKTYMAHLTRLAPDDDRA